MKMFVTECWTRRVATEAVPWLHLLLLVCAESILIRSVDSVIYLNKWAVEILGGPETADEVATHYGFRNLGQIGTLENYYLFEHRRLVRRSLKSSRHHYFSLEREPHVLWVEQQTAKRRFKRSNTLVKNQWSPRLNDPVFPEMWYMNHGARGGHDMNVLGAWRLGYTGKGIVVTILDDGIEHSHSDLQRNYDPDASYDFIDSDSDPSPRYDKSEQNRHGTRCAGEVAAVGNNSLCGVGIAFRSRIGGIRMLDGDVSDVIEAEALSFKPEHVDIYSASWGPEDNGKVIEAPGTLATQALLHGISKGRDGKGSIYIWASGNGGSVSDSCSCDGYASSVYTLSVSSTSEFGVKPWYLEECSSTLATTYSSGETYRERKIFTTDIYNRCIDNHTGTSASAPLAAGMCALALEANPDLTWRDMQYIVLLTSRAEPLRDAQWVKNAIGRYVSHRYGYGLMDGQAMVLLAEQWTTVPEQHVCKTEVLEVNKRIEKDGITLTIESNGCNDSSEEINYLEHVQAKVSLNYSRRGDLQIHLISPNGTRSTLLPRRKNDYEAGRFNGWSFMSVFYWGEQPRGTWTLILENVGPNVNFGTFEKWQLVLYGTKADPINLKSSSDSPKRPIFHYSSDIPLDVKTLMTSEMKTGFFTTNRLHQNKTMATSTTTKSTTISITKKLMATSTTTKTTTAAAVATTTTSTTTRKEIAAELKTTVKIEEVVAPETSVKTKVVPGSETPANAELITDVIIKPEETTVMITDVTRSPQNISDHHLIGLPSSEVTIVSYICDNECTENGCTDSGPENCLACKHVKLFLNNRCVSSCPGETFEESGICYSCQLPCLECTGRAEDGYNCVSCASGYFLLEADVNDAGNGNKSRCIDSCPPQYFSDILTRLCLPCSSNCISCLDSSSDCQFCFDGFDLIDFVCIEICKQSEYRDEEDGSCKTCDLSCDTCLGPVSTDCLTCAIDMFQENELCVSSCSDGYYVEITDDGLICQMCHPSCSACLGPAENECYSCYHPLKHVASSCVDSCPIGHFEGINGVCHFCHENCAACIGPDENDCLSCVGTRFYFDGHCIENCSDGFYPVEVFNHVIGETMQRCERCHGTCRTCTAGSSMDCIRCFQGLLFSHGRCVIHCESNEYEDSDECLECHSKCATCFGPLTNQCLECDSDRVLYNGQCLGECPRGYYEDGGRCRLCSLECDSCDDYGSDNCEACSPDYEMLRGSCVKPGIQVEDTEDVTICSLGEFYNTAEDTCSSCDESCSECSAFGRNKCLSCFSPNVLHSETRRCLSCCSNEGENVALDCCICDNDFLASCIKLIRSSFDLLTSESNISSSRPVTSPLIVSMDTSTRVETSLTSSEVNDADGDNYVSMTTESSSSLLSSSSLEEEYSASSSTDGSIILSISPPPPPSPPPHHTIEGESPVELTTPSSSNFQTFSESDWTSWPTTPSSSSTVQDDSTTETTSSGRLFILSPWVLVLFVVLCVGTLCALTFILIFCLLQAKARDKLCWSSRRPYRPVPMIYQNGAKKVVIVGKPEGTEVGGATATQV